jgi:hypothetical protein
MATDMEQNRRATRSPHADRANGRRDRVAIAGGESAATVQPRTAHWLGRCFYACGADGMPTQMRCQGTAYVLVKVLKHDFMAATGLYEAAVGAGGPGKVICKISRRMHFCGVPLGWLGRLLTRSEVRNLRRCEGVHGVPHVLDRIEPNVYVYAYIEGVCLAEKPALPPDFFEKLKAVLDQIHARRLVHFDLHKPGNILVGADGHAYILDFQLCTYLGDRCLLSRRLSSRLRRRLQAYDVYHVYKHKRRLLPAKLTEAEDKLSRNNSLPLRMHRAIASPYKRVRRACLRHLHAKGVLAGSQSAKACTETDPARWTKPKQGG